MGKKNNVVESNNITRKEFKYAKGLITLTFTLRVDVKSELKDFLDCLNVATAEVEREILKEI